MPFPRGSGNLSLDIIPSTPFYFIQFTDGYYVFRGPVRRACKVDCPLPGSPIHGSLRQGRSWDILTHELTWAPSGHVALPIPHRDGFFLCGVGYVTSAAPIISSWGTVHGGRAPFYVPWSSLACRHGYLCRWGACFIYPHRGTHVDGASTRCHLIFPEGAPPGVYECICIIKVSMITLDPFCLWGTPRTSSILFIGAEAEGRVISEYRAVLGHFPRGMFSSSTVTSW